MKKFLLLLLFLFSKGYTQTPSQTTVSLDQIFELAQKHSLRVQALDKSIAALKNEIRARDVELATFLTSELRYEDDLRESLTSPTTQMATTGEISLKKLFSTGTTLELITEHDVTKFNTSPVENNAAQWEIG